MSEFPQELESLAGKVTEFLEKLHPDDSVTAWDLKFKLKTALSPLYMALGILQDQGRIRITQDGLNYRVQLTASRKPTQAVVGVPIQIPVPSDETADAKSSS